MDSTANRKVSIPRQARSQQKREALLASGRILMTERDFEQITTHDIAAHAGVSVGTFYRYFADKADVATCLIRDHIDRYFIDFGELEAAADASTSPIERVTSRILSHLRWSREFPLASIIRTLSKSSPDLYARIQLSRVQATLRLAEQVRVLQRYDVAWPDLDPRLSAVTIMALVMAIAEQDLEDDDEVLARHLAIALVRMLLRPDYHR